MRKIKVFSALLLIMILTLGLFGCKVELPEPSDVSSVDEAISMDFYAKENEVTIKVGDYEWMKVNIKIDYEYALQWSSSNPKIATVDSSGRVDALSPGKVTITAHAKKASVDFSVTVVESKPEKLSMSTAIVANDTVIQENSVSQRDANLYRILINASTNCTTVYTYNSNGVYNVAVRSMVCSVGKNNLTPGGTYTLSNVERWHNEDGKYYQYYCELTNENEQIDVSSSAYKSQGTSALITKEYNKLGTAYTEGDVRFCVDDAKWIYENCPEGTLFKIAYNRTDPLGIPTPIKVSEGSKHSGWDPTDSHENNPFKKIKPVFEGVADTYVLVNSVFDAYDGVEVYDTGSNLVTDKITIDGNVDCSKEGKYILTYLYTDGLGRTGRADRVVTVLGEKEYREITR